MKMMHCKMTMSVQNKLFTVIKFFSAENVARIDICRQMKVVYGDDCVHIGIVQPTTVGIHV